MFTRKRPSPGSEMAKSISKSLTNRSRCSAVIRAKAVWRTVSGESTCLFTGKICPSILILMGALQVKNRSEAFFSTISLKRGLVLSCGCEPEFAGAAAAVGEAKVPVASRSVCGPALNAGSGASLIGILYGPAVFLFDDLQRAAVIDGLVLTLALELDTQPQLVLRVGVAHRVLVGDETRLVELIERLIEGLHAEPRRARHDVLDLRHLAFEDEVLDERRVQHDLHGRDTAGAALARHQAPRDERPDVERQVHQQLRPALVGEEVDDAVQRLVGVVGVQRREHQVPGLGELNAVLHGLAVADLADQDDIRRLAKSVLERGVPRVGVDADLAVGDDAAL